MKTITVEIDKKGVVTTKTEGFTGSACQEATRSLREALGGISQTELTSEYYAMDELKERLQG